MSTLLRLIFFSALVSSPFLLSGCKDKPQQAQQAPEAAYVVIGIEEVAVINELSGRLESYRNSDVRARVAGVLEKRLFEEGSDVKKGDTLFIIDPRSYEASVQDAKATLARAQANFMQADLKYKRYIPLVEISAVSRQEFDDALAAQKQAAADVASAKAALINARLNLEYATVLAPISGRIGRSIVTEGALVGQGEVTLLAVIQQIDPIYLNLTQSSAELLQLQQAMKKGLLKDASEEGLKVTLIMEDGTTYAHPGKLLFSDITVDPSTGEISIRALFPNPEGLLLPGVYVRGRLEQAINENAITVPKQAVQRSTEGSTVIVINGNNIAEVRKVQTSSSYREKWVVLDGLKPGDKVIVEGLQKIRPGQPVLPVLWEKKSAPAEGTNAASPANAQKNAEKAPGENTTTGNNVNDKKTDASAAASETKPANPDEKTATGKADPAGAANESAATNPARESAVPKPAEAPREISADKNTNSTENASAPASGDAAPHSPPAGSVEKAKG